ncbi:unnamed protein product [Closterium sp. Yama58-4]|nr:unnamed protein product [Closterium sp. Yama58-4]
MCVARDDSKVAPGSSSPIFANSTFATASDPERRTFSAASVVNAESAQSLAPTLSAGWSRLTHALSASRAPSSTRTGGAAETPSTCGTAGSPRREPSKDAEPALLLLPDGSVQIVCSSQPSAHSQTRTLTPKKNTNGSRDSSRVAASMDSNSIPGNLAPSKSMESIPRGSDARRATRVSDVLQDHPGCQVGSLTSSHGFLRPQHVLKPGHVYFLQPPLALPAPDDHGTSVSGNGDADFGGGGGSTTLLVQNVDACNEDDFNHGRRLLEDVVGSFSGSSGRRSESDVARSSGNSAETEIISVSARSFDSFSTLSAGTAGTSSVQDALLLAPFPSSSLYRTPCACCNDGLRSASTSHSAAHSLTHAHSLPHSVSSAMRAPSPSALSPMAPTSPFAESPRRPSRSTRGHSRLGQKNATTVPENPGHPASATAAATHTFTSAAAQESCSSHLMHRGWCAASRGANLELWTGMSGTSGKSWFNCNSNTGAAAAMENHQAVFEALESPSSTPARKFGGGSGSGNSSTSSSSSSISSIDNTSNQQMRRVPFCVRGRAVVTAEDMVFGRVGPTVA